MRHFNPVIGGKTVSPIRIADARAEIALLARHRKGHADDGAVLPQGGATRPAGRRAGRRGPSHRPAPRAHARPPGLRRHLRPLPFEQGRRCRRRSASLASSAGPGYLDRFKDWWTWTQTAGFKRRCGRRSRSPTSSTNNYLSTDARIPVTLLRTNLCSPLATNAIRRQHLGQFLVRILQAPAERRLGQLQRSLYRRAPPTTHAGRRARLYAAAVADLALVDRALSCSTTGSASSTRDPSVEAPGRRVRGLASARCCGRRRRDMDAVFGNRVEGIIDRTERAQLGSSSRTAISRVAETGRRRARSSALLPAAGSTTDGDLSSGRSRRACRSAR